MCIINGNGTVYWLSIYILHRRMQDLPGFPGRPGRVAFCLNSGVVRGGGGQLPPGVGRQIPTNEIIKIYYERNLEEKTERIK